MARAAFYMHTHIMGFELQHRAEWSLTRLNMRPRWFAALVQNPHALSIHQAIWRALGQLQHPASLVSRYRDLTEHAVFYLDPHICMRCRYRSTELLWQCPHCHDWNTFVEERIAPANDPTEVEA
jgi:lipopolysaccharide biosynthesis regulator YciM